MFPPHAPAYTAYDVKFTNQDNKEEYEYEDTDEEKENLKQEKSQNS